MQKQIKAQLNEQGKYVYELPFQISERFGVLANELDNNKHMYAIRDYEIRNSTLEEVFIRLGNLEKEQDEKEEQQDQDRQDDYEPEYQEVGCFGLLVASLDYHFRTSSLYFLVLIVASILMGANMAGQY